MARVDTLKNFLTDIADKFREKLGITGAISHADYDTKIEEVYDKGEADGREEMRNELFYQRTDSWQYFSVQNSRNHLVPFIRYDDTSNAISFSHMFWSCGLLSSVPLINTSKGINFSSMFEGSYRLTSIPNIDTSNGTSFRSMFKQCTALTKIPKLNTSKGTSFDYMFQLCSNLTEIPEIDMTNCTSMYGMFEDCTALTTITFTGTIKITANISILKQSPNLTLPSLESFINALINSSTTTYRTVTIGSTNLAKLTQDQIDDIYTNKKIILA